MREEPKTCCVCKKPILDDACNLIVSNTISFPHHLKCGHVNGSGTELIPELAVIVGLYKVNGFAP